MESLRGREEDPLFSKTLEVIMPIVQKHTPALLDEITHQMTYGAATIEEMMEEIFNSLNSKNITSFVKPNKIITIVKMIRLDLAKEMDKQKYDDETKKSVGRDMPIIEQNLLIYFAAKTVKVLTQQ